MHKMSFLDHTYKCLANLFHLAGSYCTILARRLLHQRGTTHPQYHPNYTHNTTRQSTDALCNFHICILATIINSPDTVASGYRHTKHIIKTPDSFAPDICQHHGGTTLLVQSVGHQQAQMMHWTKKYTQAAYHWQRVQCPVSEMS